MQVTLVARDLDPASPDGDAAEATAALAGALCDAEQVRVIVSARHEGASVLDPRVAVVRVPEPTGRLHKAFTSASRMSANLPGVEWTQGELLTVGDLEIRPDQYLARAGGRTLRLSLRELDVLCALARRAGRIVTRAELYEAVWGGEWRPDDRSVDVYVHKLRTKLAAALPDWSYIHTHFGFGYRLQPEPSHPFHTAATGR